MAYSYRRLFFLLISQRSLLPSFQRDPHPEMYKASPVIRLTSTSLHPKHFMCNVQDKGEWEPLALQSKKGRSDSPPASISPSSYRTDSEQVRLAFAGPECNGRNDRLHWRREASPTEPREDGTSEPIINNAGLTLPQFEFPVEVGSENRGDGFYIGLDVRDVVGVLVIKQSDRGAVRTYANGKDGFFSIIQTSPAAQRTQFELLKLEHGQECEVLGSSAYRLVKKGKDLVQ
jgi:hypothetical protein